MSLCTNCANGPSLESMLGDKHTTVTQPKFRRTEKKKGTMQRAAVDGNGTDGWCQCLLQMPCGHEARGSRARTWRVQRREKHLGKCEIWAGW